MQIRGTFERLNYGGSGVMFSGSNDGAERIGVILIDGNLALMEYIRGRRTVLRQVPLRPEHQRLRTPIVLTLTLARNTRTITVSIDDTEYFEENLSRMAVNRFGFIGRTGRSGVDAVFNKIEARWSSD